MRSRRGQRRARRVGHDAQPADGASSARARRHRSSRRRAAKPVDAPRAADAASRAEPDVAPRPLVDRAEHDRRRERAPTSSRMSPLRRARRALAASSHRSGAASTDTIAASQQEDQQDERERPRDPPGERPQGRSPSCVAQRCASRRRPLTAPATSAFTRSAAAKGSTPITAAVARLPVMIVELRESADVHHRDAGDRRERARARTACAARAEPSRDRRGERIREQVAAGRPRAAARCPARPSA